MTLESSVCVKWDIVWFGWTVPAKKKNFSNNVNKLQIQIKLMPGLIIQTQILLTTVE